MKRRPLYDQLVQNRTISLFYWLAFLYLILAGRFVWLQVVRASDLRAKAEGIILAEYDLPARRGTIYDCNGNKLATTIDACDIGVRPKAIKDKPAAAALLAPLVGQPEKQIFEKMTSRKKFFYLARQVDVTVGEKISKAAIPGVDVLKTMKRVYPGHSLAAHVIGFVNLDGKGIAGIEQTYDEILSGKNGHLIAQRDARGRIIPGSVKERVEPVHGKDIVLTLDSTIQRALETALDKESVSKFSAAGASAVVMDPHTGAILALANMPTFDPNNPGNSQPDSRRNRAVTDLYEPGSTLKTITACAALEEGVIDTNDTFYCKGSMQIGRRTIRCSLHPPFMGGHGACDVAKVLRYSCNMGAASIGLKLGREKLYAYEKAFGLYEKPGSDLLGEAAGWHDRWQDWADVRTANVAFGQGIAVTPLQMTRAYCAVVNGGFLMRPYIVKEIRRPDGTVEQTFHPKVVRRVISDRTSSLVCGMLEGVVTDGTGKPARVEGYKVGGKTGSAQKASTTGRGYAPGKFVASFVGFLPVSDPRLVILVAVDEPKGLHWGATCAAPVFQRVAAKAMWYLKVPPDDQPPPASSPFTGKSQSPNARTGAVTPGLREPVGG